MDRQNGLRYIIANTLIYLAAPVTYVGVVQAALCNQLGASASISNLPASAYLLGFIAPIVASWAIPHRLERSTVVVANTISTALLALVGLSLMLPLDATLRIVILIGQASVLGISGSISQVFMLQCLARGTTSEGRARAFKLTFTLGPIAAVIGSLTAQIALSGGIAFLVYPHDFAALYLAGALCMAGVALASRRFLMVAVESPPRLSFFRYAMDSIKSFARERESMILWFSYCLWFSTLAAMPNLSLYTKEILGRDPKELSGLIMALRFGFKSIGGFLLGVLTSKCGVRAPVVATILLVGGAVLWAGMTPGYLYLLSFGWMGAGELGGAYFPNYMVSISSMANGARNQSLLALATPAASFAPTLHGIMTDLFGFAGSFVLGGTTAVLSLGLALKLPSLPGADQKVSSGKADKSC
jgi:MFS family permease